MPFPIFPDLLLAISMFTNKMFKTFFMNKVIPKVNSYGVRFLSLLAKEVNSLSVLAFLLKLCNSLSYCDIHNKHLLTSIRNAVY